MSATTERQNKRRNLTRWRLNRLQRLRNIPRQQQTRMQGYRIIQLEDALFGKFKKGTA